MKKAILLKESSGRRWVEYLEFCNEHAQANRWFRGVTKHTYALLPKIGRGHEGSEWRKTITIGRSKINLAQREKRIFEAFRRRARLGLATIPTTTIEWLAIAQHHGVPTRLLDWTTNPLMAAWFATSAAHADNHQVARVHCVFVSPLRLVNEDDPAIFDWEGAQPKFMVAPHWHPRVRAQRGCFSIHPTPNALFEPKDHHTFDIEREHWGEFRRRLYYFGVDASTVMADLAGLGEALTWQYENRIGIGQVGY